VRVNPRGEIECADGPALGGVADCHFVMTALRLVRLLASQVTVLERSRALGSLLGDSLSLLRLLAGLPGLWPLQELLTALLGALLAALALPALLLAAHLGLLELLTLWLLGLLPEAS